jgi:O-antigen ligase
MKAENKVSKINYLLAGFLGLITASGIIFLFLASPFQIIVLILSLFLLLFLIKKPILSLYFIVFLLPLERIGAYEFSGVTIRPSQIVSLIALLIFVFLYLKGRFKIIKNPLELPLGLFILVNLLSLSQAENFSRGLAVFLYVTFTILVGFLVSQLIRSSFIWNKVLRVILISAVLVSLFGLFQFLGDMIGLPRSITGLREHYTKSVFGFPRIQSTALEPLYFANYLLIPFSISLAFYLAKVKFIKKSVLLLILILMAINLILTVSRGGYLGAIMAGLVVVLFNFKYFLNLKKIIGLILILFIAFNISLRFLSWGEQLENIKTFKTHVQNVFYGPAFKERIATIKLAWKAFKEHPFLGIGVGNFGPYASLHPYLQPKEGWKIVNNEYIEILAETGLLGLALFLLIIFLIVIRSLKAIFKTKDQFLKTSLIALLGAFMGVLVQYNTFSVLYIMHIWVLIGMLIALQNIVLKKLNE